MCKVQVEMFCCFFFCFVLFSKLKLYSCLVDSSLFPTHFRGCIKANPPVIIHHKLYIMSKELAVSVWETDDRSKLLTTLSRTFKPQ